jgi:hypothetical protein
MSKPTYQVIEKKTVEFEITMPSGGILQVNLYHDTPQEDIEFVERIVRLACEEGVAEE